MAEGTPSKKITVELLRDRLDSFKKDVINTTINRLGTEKPFKAVNTATRIPDFNKKNQQGQGLKILTPQQMLSRLPISLAQLKAKNNSNKLKNEIRQLLYLLYRSKKLIKINII